MVCIPLIGTEQKVKTVNNNTDSWGYETTPKPKTKNFHLVPKPLSQTALSPYTKNTELIPFRWITLSILCSQTLWRFTSYNRCYNVCRGQTLVHKTRHETLPMFVSCNRAANEHKNIFRILSLSHFPFDLLPTKMVRPKGKGTHQRKTAISFINTWVEN